jgi:uncharacterized protein YdhG (YjbR/CyaY superfamily)
MAMERFDNIDDYIAHAPSSEIRDRLSRIRAIIREEAPEAEEYMGYGMPGYKLNGPLVYFAAFKNHVSVFGAQNMDEFADLFMGYKTSKGTVQFPHCQPLPEDLIRSLVRARKAGNLAKPKKHK